MWGIIAISAGMLILEFLKSPLLFSASAPQIQYQAAHRSSQCYPSVSLTHWLQLVHVNVCHSPSVNKPLTGKKGWTARKQNSAAGGMFKGGAQLCSLKMFSICLTPEFLSIHPHSFDRLHREEPHEVVTVMIQLRESVSMRWSMFCQRASNTSQEEAIHCVAVLLLWLMGIRLVWQLFGHITN